MIFLTGSLAICGLILTCIGSGLGIYGGLFHSTVTVQSFDLFIHIIGAMILLLTGFSPESTYGVLSVVPFGLINLDQAEKEFTSIEDKFKSDSSPSGHPHEEKDKTNPENFQLFINGLYQAEGITGVYFPIKDSLRVVFYFSIGQNYSPAAALLFLRLQAILGIGNIKIVLNKSGSPT